MKWNKFTLKTRSEVEDIVISTLADVGIEGVEIQDKQPLTESDKQQMFVDIMPDIPDDDGIAYLNFYLDVDEDKEKVLADVRAALAEMQEFLDLGECTITESETEDKDWINNWKEFFHQFFPGLGDGFEKHIVVFLIHLAEGGGDLALDVGAGGGIKGIDDAVDEVDETRHLIAVDERDLHGADLHAEMLPQCPEGAVEAAFAVVKTVDEKGLRDPLAGGVFPSLLGAHLHAGLAVHHDDGGIRHADAFEHLARKIKVAGRVENIYPDILPHQRGTGGGERKAAPHLLAVIVAHGVALADAAQPVGLMGYIQHRFCQRSFAGTAVAQQAYVTDVLGQKFFHDRGYSFTM